MSAGEFVAQLESRVKLLNGIQTYFFAERIQDSMSIPSHAGARDRVCKEFSPTRAIQAVASDAKHRVRRLDASGPLSRPPFIDRIPVPGWLGSWARGTLRA